MGTVSRKANVPVRSTSASNHRRKRVTVIARGRNYTRNLFSAQRGAFAHSTRQYLARTEYLRPSIADRYPRYAGVTHRSSSGCAVEEPARGRINNHRLRR